MKDSVMMNTSKTPFQYWPIAMRRTKKEYHFRHWDHKNVFQYCGEINTDEINTLFSPMNPI